MAGLRKHLVWAGRQAGRQIEWEGEERRREGGREEKGRQGLMLLGDECSAERSDSEIGVKKKGVSC